MASGLWSTDSVVVVHSLLLCGMWDPSGSGIEPMSPVLAGRFFITEPPGKPHILKNYQFILIFPTPVDFYLLPFSTASVLSYRENHGFHQQCVCVCVCICVSLCFCIHIQLLFMTLLQVGQKVFNVLIQL